MHKYKIILNEKEPIEDLYFKTWEISVKHNFKQNPEIFLEIEYMGKIWRGNIKGKNFTFNEKKNIEKAITKLFEKYQKTMEEDFLNLIKEKIIYINKGNEGKIFKSIDHEWVYKIIKKPKNSNINPLYLEHNVKISYNRIEKLNDDNFPVQKISQSKEKTIIYKYKNDILPTKKLNKWDLANLLKAQFKHNIFIDDNKIKNYGKRNGKTIYNDIGASFIETNDKEFQEGLIRDVYFLWKYQGNKKMRQQIKGEREKNFKTHLENVDFKEFFNYVKNGYLIVAMITTAGKRNIKESLNSIFGVSNIYIASEVKLNNYNNVLVNPFNKGLARNTMSGLAQLKLKYERANVFVATIDDDDFWKKSYIPKVRRKIEEGFNFISSWMEVRNKKKKSGSFIFKKKDVNIDTFINGNCGIQGSNKVFNLDIALESGGMPMHINSATDRAFNIELLKHKDIKVAIIESEEVIFNQDYDRERITNSINKKEELIKFYRHYNYLIDGGQKDLINKRHENLHGIKDVITW